MGSIDTGIITYSLTTIPTIRQTANRSNGTLSNGSFFILSRFTDAKVVKKGKSEK